MKSDRTMRAWLANEEKKSRSLFQLLILILAAFFFMGHYTIDELAYQPEKMPWLAWAFWRNAFVIASIPFINFFVWKLVALGRVETSKPILTMSIVILVGSVVAFFFPMVMRFTESIHLCRFNPSVERWPWFTFRFYWTYWTPLVLTTGNLTLLRKWKKMANELGRKPESNDGSLKRRSGVTLKKLATACAVASLGIAGLHYVLPRLSAGRVVINLTRRFLVGSQERREFDYLITTSFSDGQTLKPLLTHLELSDLQRHQFYSHLDEAIFRQYILSPVIDKLPLSETDWRHTLWENFYPKIRHESDPMNGAQIVVRLLRQRVGIDPSYDYRVGVETIWAEQMTDTVGFERVYVASLRAVGIAARLNESGQTELFGNDKWRLAPRPSVSTLENNSMTVPRNGLVNFRNWTDKWPY